MAIYKYTFRFNASHSVTGDRRDAHVHSFVVATYLKYFEHVPYDETEKQLKRHLSQYKGTYLNDSLVKEATIENIAECLFHELDEIIGGDILVSLELSDSPVACFKIRRME